MADEKIEEITPGGGRGGNPMIPAIAVLVLMPVLSFALTKFVFIPQIQSAVTDSVHKATGMEGDHGGDNSSHGGKADSHGGGHGGGDSHGGAKADSHGGGHGGGDAHGGGGDAHGGGHGDTSGGGVSGNTYEFDGILANLSGSSMNRYVRVSFIIEGSEPGFAGIMEQNRVKLIDATISVLSSLSSFDLQSAGVKNQVRSKLIAAFDAVLKKRMVEGLYFSEFVVQ